MIQAQDLVKRYGDFEAVKGVSFEAQSGEIVGLLGPNGAGKTTIMKILTCYHFPSSGKASMNGIDVEEDPLGVKKLSGYLPETVPVYTDLTVMEYLDFMAESRGLSGSDKKKKIERAIAECGVGNVAYRPIEKLSKGFRQRTGLAQAILHEPAILILDEPTTGLDPNQILEIRELIRNLGKEKTVILSTHILQEVEAVCSRVLILNEGRIAAQGTTEQIANTMKGETIYDLTLKGIPAEELKITLASIPKLISVDTVTSVGDACRAKLTMEPVDETGEIIFDWAVGRKVKILEMVRNRVSLEDIFVRLTREGEVPASQNPPKAEGGRV